MEESVADHETRITAAEENIQGIETALTKEIMLYFHLVLEKVHVFILSSCNEIIVPCALFPFSRTADDRC